MRLGIPDIRKQISSLSSLLQDRFSLIKQAHSGYNRHQGGVCGGYVYSNELKNRAIKQVIEDGYPVQEVAERLGASSK